MNPTILGEKYKIILYRPGAAAGKVQRAENEFSYLFIPVWTSEVA